MSATDVASILRTVKLPTVQHMLRGSLEPIRAAIGEASAQTDSHQWMALHLVLGTALRLRARYLPLSERVQMCMDAVSAFEAALSQCHERQMVRQLRSSRVGTNHVGWQTSTCTTVRDGVQMVLDAAAVPVNEGVEILHRAVKVFSDSAENTDRVEELDQWIAARSNLGCALTLLGQRTVGIDSVLHLERAIDVLTEAAFACSGDELLEERASAYVNLAEAFQIMAERSMPGERLRYAEQSLTWIAAGLSVFVPAEFRWLLELDRAALA